MDEIWYGLLAFSGTLALSLVVAFTIYKLLREILLAAANIVTRQLTTSIEVHACYGRASNVASWLRHLIEHYCGEKLGHFAVVNDIINFKSRRDYRLHSFFLEDLNEPVVEKKQEDDDSSDDLRKQIDPLQTTSSVFFWYKGTCIRISRKVNRDLRNQDSPTEIFTVTAYGTRNKKLLMHMLEEGRKMAEKKPPKYINYYKAEHQMGHSSWRLVKRIEPRTLSSIILKEGITDVIRNDLEEFIESKEWYKERGIPYRRGYLLYGPPGCGKTSFVKAVSGQIGYDIHELQLSSLSLTDESLNTLMSSISQKAILLFEDVDAVFLPRHQEEHKNDGLLGKLKIRESKGKLSFSGLLNAIDGVASEEDYIVFMTTNQIEKLDTALIRPGRIDLRQLIDYPDEQQIKCFFKKFYPDCNDETAIKFAKAVVKLKCNPSVAQIQGIFLKHKHEPEDNLLDVDSLIEMCKDNADLGVHNIYL